MDISQAILDELARTLANPFFANRLDATDVQMYLSPAEFVRDGEA